ncbi:MAG TPA: hypothetical protein VJ673_07860 [Aromatoleum sp.]|uniref:hypothetical protein n=1 Tax=Aromatoleum sp. TaxID=2307007 RepID=UPI002B48B2A5|nr:hypothetical protein [Aromatoleum sp.]HJV25587.1 hypothetical protein [Aromatoleum sp.]
MSRRPKRYLAAAFAAILVEAGGLPDGALRWVLNPVYGAGDAGFSPGLCAQGHPSAELLALADWPLDPAGSGCSTAESGGMAETVMMPDTVVTAVAPVAAIEFQPLAPVDIEVPVSPPPAPPSRLDPEPVLFSGALVEDDALDSLRGGFETPGGLVMSFGVERLVYINGALTSMTRLNVLDLGQLRGAGIDPAQLPTIGSTLAVIQNGPNNSFVAEGLASGAIATVIQNSLDNQRIQAVTTINATVNSLELMRANRLGESLRSAVSGAMIR